MSFYTITGIFQLGLEPRHIQSCTPKDVLIDIIVDTGLYIDVDAILEDMPPEVRRHFRKKDIVREWEGLTAEGRNKLLEVAHELWQEFIDEGVVMCCGT